MDRFKDKLDKALEVRGTRDRIVALRAQKLTSESERRETTLTEEEIVELIVGPEKWRERRTLLEYDLYDFEVIDTFEVEAGNTQDTADYQILNALRESLLAVSKNNYGRLKKDQKSYFYAGDENGPNPINIGLINGRMCILGDSSRVIFTPLLDTFLKATNTYVDAVFQGQRIRFSAGSYSLNPSDDTYTRHDTVRWAGNIPGGLHKEKTIRVSILEPNEPQAEVELYTSSDTEVVVDAIVEDEIEQPEEQVAVYPALEAQRSFNAIQEEVFNYLKTLPPTRKLSQQLENVDNEAIQLPPVYLDNQSLSLALRTSPTADILFFYNSSIRSDQERVADVLDSMTESEFLELGNDDERRERLLHDTLTEKGFFLIRQHDGQFLLMDRDVQKYPIVTTDSPFFLDLLEKAEDRLAEYFAALSDQGPTTVPLRDKRRQLAAEIEATMPRSERIQDTMWQKVWHWLIKP